MMSPHYGRTSALAAMEAAGVKPDIPTDWAEMRQ